MPRRLLRALATVAFLCCLIPSEPRAAFFNTPSDQRFHLGQASTPANNVFISCSGNNIVMNVPVKIQLPFTGLQWDTTVGAPTKGGPNAGLIDPIPVPTVSQITMNPNTSFVAPQNFTVGNLSLRNFTLVRPPQSLQMSINNGSTFPFTDTNGFSVRVADIPSVASSAAQTLSPGLTVPMTAFTVTESADGTNGGIWAATDLRLTIPLIAGLAHVTWSGTPTCSGNAVTNGRVAASPGFTLTEDGGRTARIFVGADFQASESVTISGLNYVVSGTCPDTSFQVGVRTGDSTNATVHRFDANSKTVQGLPTISSAAPNQVFTRGDPSTPANTITIKDSPGTSKFTVGPAGGDIRIKIPASFNCTWDTSIGSVVIGPPAVGPSGAARVSTTLLPYENGGRTAVLNVTSNFPNATSEGFTVSGLAFANFTGTSLAVPLELESTNDTTSEAFDNRTIAIGTPTIASSGAQIFQTSPPGPATVGMATLTIREDLFIPRIGTSAGRVSSIRITIPAAFPMTWEGLSPAVTTGKLSTVVSYAGGNKTLVLSATADFATNETATVSGLNFVLTAAAATPDNLQLFMSGAGTATVTDLDSQIIAIGGVATISSAANQAFTTNSPPVLAQPILITDANGVASITAANDIRITIPAGFNMVWDGSVGSVGIGLPPSGPSGAGKVSTILLPYEDAGRTAVLNVGINFSINEGFVVTGLRFANFTNSSPSNNLLLRVTAVGPPANADDKSIAIGKPVISIPASQVYGTNDPSTLFPTITIGDDAVTPRITAGPVGGDVRIRIPAGLSMVWDTSVTTPTITWLGAGGSKVSGTLLPYEDLNKTVVVDITAPFAAGDSFTIAGLRVLPGAAETGPLALELETDNASSLANATTAPRTVTVNNRPTIVSSTTLDSDGNGSIDRLIITFSEQINPAGVSATTGAGLALAGYIIANGTPGTPNINSITYRLAESGLPDTGVTPALTYDPLASGADLADMQGLATSSLASPLRLDAAAPVVVGFSAADTDGNGRLNSIVVTFSENLVAGQEDINDWILIDANGTTNLLAGLTSGSLSIVNNTLTITLTNTDGSAGVPRFQYKSDGLNGTLRDAAGNLVPFQTNNTAPVANAGPNQTLAPTKVTLNGSASSDPDGQPVSFQWLQTLGPPVILNDSTVAQPHFLATTAGLYRFQLTVSDTLAVAIDSVDITILNVPPISRPLFDQVQLAGTQTFIFGFFSSDINGDFLNYNWAQVGSPPAPAAPPSNPTFQSTDFTPAVAGVYDYDLTVSDPALNTNTSRLRVRVHSGTNVVPTAHAGPDQTVPVGTAATLDGRLSSSPIPPSPVPPTHALTYAWSSNSTVPPFAAAGATATFTPTSPGTYVIQLVVTDSSTLVSSPPATMTVNAFPANRPPVAFASKLSPVLPPVVGELVTLDSTGSVDPEGGALSYAWVQLKGPSVLLSSLSAARPSFTAVQAGTYEFQLLVTDGANWSQPTVVRFPIIPNSGYVVPSAVPSLVTATKANGHIDAGATPTVVMNVTTGGNISDWWWEQVGGPAVVLNSNFPGRPTFPADFGPISFTPTAAGLYTFRVTAGDFFTGVLSITTFDVVVDMPTNNAPEANAGTNQTGVAAGTTVTLDGGLTIDPGPGPVGGLTAFWTQLSGPPVTLTNGSTLQPTFVPPVAGTYVFQLNVSDGEAASGPSLVEVTVTGSTATVVTKGGGGGCGMGPEALLLVGLLAWSRRRLRR